MNWKMQQETCGPQWQIIWGKEVERGWGSIENSTTWEQEKERKRQYQRWKRSKQWESLCAQAGSVICVTVSVCVCEPCDRENICFRRTLIRSQKKNGMVKIRNNQSRGKSSEKLKTMHETLTDSLLHYCAAYESLIKFRESWSLLPCWLFQVHL